MIPSNASFRAALLDAGLPTPDGLIDPQGRPAGKRFDVYRNNVAVSLTEALSSAFPILQKLLGETNFQTLAGIYLRRHPPRDPMIALYGDAMPAFLESFEPVATLPYLPDIARLELALRQSYHAGDSVPADLAPLAVPDPSNVRFTLAPSLRLIRSNWPIHAIWRLNTEPDAPKVTMVPQDVLITRPEYDPLPHLLPLGGGAFIAALLSGATLGAALGTTNAETFDLTTTLGLLISGNAITALEAE